MHILLTLLLLFSPALAKDRTRQLCKEIQRELDEAVQAGWLSERESNEIMIRCYTSKFKNK